MKECMEIKSLWTAADMVLTKKEDPKTKKK